MSGDIRLIVLNSTRTGDNALVVHTLSREYGRRSFLVRGLKKPGLAARLMPLSLIEGKVSEISQSSLWPLSRISTVHPLSGIRGNLYKNTMSLFMSEVLYRIIKDGSNEDGLFDWCCECIMTLENLPGDFSNSHILFLLSLASTLGFSPDRKSIAPFAKGFPEQLYSLIELPFAGAMLLPLTGEERSRICEEILQYLEYHCETSLHVRSLEVLQEIFH